MLASLLSFFRNNTMKLYPDDLKATLGYHERMNRGAVTPIQAEVEALRKYVRQLESADFEPEQA